METSVNKQLTILDDHLEVWLDAFLLARKTQGIAKRSIEFYSDKLRTFTQFCSGQEISRITQIDPNSIRLFLLHLTEKGHNPGGVHAYYRSLKAFLLWWEDEYEPEGWKNPIRKVKAPKVALEPRDPVPLEDVRALIDACEGRKFNDLRDKAIFLCLLDTGARASEFLNLNWNDVNHITGEILIRAGKGGKPRFVFIGAKARKALRNYRKVHPSASGAVWVINAGERLSIWGLRSMINYRSRKAGVKKPSLHAFRRAFAINMLRAGADIFSLQKLMGHADITVLRRYLAQDNQDVQVAHKRASPVDYAL
jgi:site-specific recombinase XerD